MKKKLPELYQKYIYFYQRYRSQKILFDSKSPLLKLGNSEKILFEKLESKTEE